MNDSNPENPPENIPAAAPQVDTRRRLRELLSVPERDRTDEQWDEIIELEIQLAPGNRISGNESHGGGSQGRNPMSHGKPGGGPVVVAEVLVGNRRSIARAPTTIVGRARTSRSPVAAIQPEWFVSKP